MGSWPEREVRAAAAEAGLVCVPVLARGALKQVQDLPAAFPSRVRGLFGLPEIEGNLAEGYVLKPAVEWDAAEEVLEGTSAGWTRGRCRDWSTR